MQILGEVQKSKGERLKMNFGISSPVSAKWGAFCFVLFCFRTEAPPSGSFHLQDSEGYEMMGAHRKS